MLLELAVGGHRVRVTALGPIPLRMGVWWPAQVCAVGQESA
jgi:hypothetical protein